MIARGNSQLICRLHCLPRGLKIDRCAFRQANVSRASGGTSSLAATQSSFQKDIHLCLALFVEPVISSSSFVAAFLQWAPMQVRPSKGQGKSQSCKNISAHNAIVDRVEDLKRLTDIQRTGRHIELDSQQAHATDDLTGKLKQRQC